MLGRRFLFFFTAVLASAFAWGLWSDAPSAVTPPVVAVDGLLMTSPEAEHPPADHGAASSTRVAPSDPNPVDSGHEGPLGDPARRVRSFLQASSRLSLTSETLDSTALARDAAESIVDHIASSGLTCDDIAFALQSGKEEVPHVQKPALMLALAFADGYGEEHRQLLLDKLRDSLAGSEAASGASLTAEMLAAVHALRLRGDVARIRPSVDLLLSSVAPKQPVDRHRGLLVDLYLRVAMPERNGGQDQANFHLAQDVFERHLLWSNQCVGAARVTMAQDEVAIVSRAAQESQFSGYQALQLAFADSPQSALALQQVLQQSRVPMVKGWALAGLLAVGHPDAAGAAFNCLRALGEHDVAEIERGWSTLPPDRLVRIAAGLAGLQDSGQVKGRFAAAIGAVIHDTGSRWQMCASERARLVLALGEGIQQAKSDAVAQELWAMACAVLGRQELGQLAPYVSESVVREAFARAIR